MKTTPRATPSVCKPILWCVCSLTLRTAEDIRAQILPQHPRTPCKSSLLLGGKGQPLPWATRRPHQLALVQKMAAWKTKAEKCCHCNAPMYRLLSLFNIIIFHFDSIISSFHILAMLSLKTLPSLSNSHSSYICLLCCSKLFVCTQIYCRCTYVLCCSLSECSRRWTRTEVRTNGFELSKHARKQGLWERERESSGHKKTQWDLIGKQLLSHPRALDNNEELLLFLK